MKETSQPLTLLAEFLEARDIESVLRFNVRLFFGLAVIALTGYLFIGGDGWGHFARNSTLLIVGTIITLFFLNKKQLTWAIYSSLTIYGTILFYSAWNGAGVKGTTYMLFVLVVLGSALFIGRRAGYIAAAIASLLGLILLWAGRIGLLLNLERPSLDFVVWITLAVGFFVAAHLVSLVGLQIERSLTKAQKDLNKRIRAEAEVRRVNSELEQRVAERTSELTANQETYRRQAHEMSLLYKLGNSLAAGQSLYNTLYALQTEITQIIQADAFYVAIYDENTHMVQYPISFDQGDPALEPSRNLIERPGLTGAVIFRGRTLYLPDMTEKVVEEEYAPVDNHHLPLRTFLGVPLQANNAIIGMLSVQSNQTDAYDANQILMVEYIAVQAALAIDKMRLLDRLQKELVERQRAEQALSFSEEKFSKAFHTTPVLMSIENAEGRFIDVNQAFADAIGYQREECIGRNASELKIWASVEDKLRVRDMIQQDYFKDLELRLRRVNGEVGVVLMSSEKFKVNQAEYSITSALDITERKRIEAEREKLIAELEAKNRELEHFTHTVSHDLKAPLVTIRSFLGFLEKDALAGNFERMKNDLARIVSATDKMQRLVSELLELSRVGHTLTPLTMVSFGAVVQEAANLVSGRIMERGVRVEIAPDLPIVYADRARLVQAMQNLIDNAVKFMGVQTEPHIQVGQRGFEADGKPILFVYDNGMGIEAQQMPKVFGLFNKLDERIEGTGVGLALVKRIIEAHGGRIWLESAGLGEGATFYFTLPSSSP